MFDLNSFLLLVLHQLQFPDVGDYRSRDFAKEDNIVHVGYSDRGCGRETTIFQLEKRRTSGAL